MDLYCTRPRCPRPQNYFADLDNPANLNAVQQKYCTACGMPLILRERYLPSKLLGRGGFGAAFLACDRDIPDLPPCVVKQFQPAGDLTPTQLELAQQLFEREAKVLSKLGRQHPQIPDLYAFFALTVPGWQSSQPDKLFYLVQEYIDGQDLEQELAQKGKFSEAEVVEVLQQILPVLQFVHDNGSIHRDIKPSNIMRHKNGKLYLLDFGAVKEVTTAAIAPSGASTGIWSQGFAPLEQMSGSQVFPSTDLYALAAAAVSLLTGKEPTELFDSSTLQWVWYSHAPVSKHLADILDKMLATVPNQRYQSAQEVLDALSQPQVRSQPQLQPPQPQPQPLQQSPQPIVSSPQRPAFTILEILGGAAFSGFEGTLVFIALSSVLSPSPLSLGLAAFLLSIFILAQTRRWIEREDLLIITAITLAIVFFLPILQGTLGIQTVLIYAVAASLVSVAVTALFRLIYKLLSSLL